MKTVIRVVCSYCKKHLGEKDGQGVEGVSHGICGACLVRLLVEASESFADRKSAAMVEGGAK